MTRVFSASTSRKSAAAGAELAVGAALPAGAAETAVASTSTEKAATATDFMRFGTLRLDGMRDRQTTPAGRAVASRRMVSGLGELGGQPRGHLGRNEGGNV